MKINNNNSSTNFTGTFILQPKNLQTKQAIPNIIKKSRQVFYDIKRNGDVAVVTKDRFDHKVRDFIASTNTDFEYYPEISIYNSFDSKNSFGLQKLLFYKNNCEIHDLKTLDTFLNKNTPLSKQIKYLRNSMDTLRLNIELPEIKIDKNNLFVIRDEARKRTLKSTGFNNGDSFIHIIPDSKFEETKKFRLVENGKRVEKEYKTPDEILYFLKMFKKAINNKD